MLGTLDQHAIEDVLRNGVIGRLGLISGGVPYVVPITYAYDEHCIVGHSAAGHKLAALRSSDVVCFEVEDVTDLGNWRSVIAWGRYEELEGTDVTAAFDLLMERVVPHMPAPAEAGASSGGAAPEHEHGATATATEHGHGAAGEAVVYRIHIHEATGRFETRP